MSIVKNTFCGEFFFSSLYLTSHFVSFSFQSSFTVIARWMLNSHHKVRKFQNREMTFLHINHSIC